MVALAEHREGLRLAPVTRANTTKVPGRLTPLERRTIKRAIAGELEPKLVQRWLAFLLRAYDSQLENARIREATKLEQAE
jgi:hypothetical protein